MSRKISRSAILFVAVILACALTAHAQQVINCSSEDGNRHSCSADTRGGVQLTNQRSGSACQQGYSWGTDQNGIWVDHGCRADFTVMPYNAYAQSGPTSYINCSSEDGHRHSCSADIRGGVQLANQRSGSPCQQGYSWGTDQNGIWVDHGCRADFTVIPYNPYAQSGPEGTINCSSEDGNRHYCPADISGGVLLVNQRSGSPCTRDYSWGEDERGLWVDHGCRADFQVGAMPGAGYRSRGAVVSCASDDGDRHICEANIRGGVRLIRQISGSACTRGYSWGVDRRGIWVDKGCRAEFEIAGGYR